MKLLITGTPMFWSQDLIDEAIRKFQLKGSFKVEKIVCGLGAGIEYGALMWARWNKIPCVGFDMGPYKHLSDPESSRLSEMVAFSDKVLLIDGIPSRKASRIMTLAIEMKKPFYHYKFKKENWK